MTGPSTFKQLIELVTILSSKKLHKTNFSHSKIEGNTLLKQLYQGIAKGVFKDDKTAAKALYNAPSSDERYEQLKHKLRNRLIKQLFLIDVHKGDYNDFQIAHYNCYHDVTAMAVLAAHAASYTSTILAERAIRTAIKYELTMIVVIFADQLEGYYCSRNKEKYQYYAAIKQKYRRIEAAEALATSYKRHLLHLHAGKNSHDDTHLTQAIAYTREIEQLLQTFDSNTFLLHAYDIISIRYEIENDYKKVIEVCDKAIAILKAKAAKTGFLYNLACSLFSYKKVSYYTTLKDYEQARISAEECLSYINTGSNNWYRVLEECTILALHTKDYKSAYNFLEQALNHPKYATKSEKIKERWMVYNAYIVYFILHYQLGLSIQDDLKLQSNRFFKKVPVFDKNKWDHHAPILLVQILFFLQRKEYDIVSCRVEELEKYFHRYLKDNATFRANCLTKMLNVMVEEASFNKNATIRKAERFLVRLRAHPLEKSKQASNVEIVPYEDIWNCVLDNLETDYWHDLKK